MQCKHISYLEAKMEWNGNYTEQKSIGFNHTFIDRVFLNLFTKKLTTKELKGTTTHNVFAATLYLFTYSLTNKTIATLYLLTHLLIKL